MSEWIELNRHLMNPPNMDSTVTVRRMAYTSAAYWNGPAWKFDWHEARVKMNESSNIRYFYKVMRERSLFWFSKINVVNDQPWYPVDVSEGCAYLKEGGEIWLATTPVDDAVAVARIHDGWVYVEGGNELFKDGVTGWWVYAPDKESYFAPVKFTKGPVRFHENGFLHLPTFTGTYQGRNEPAERMVVL